MGSQAVRLIVLLALLSSARGVASAQGQAADPLDRMLGKTVSAVKVTIEDRPVTSDQLLTLLDIKPGDTLRFDNLRRTSDRFASDPRFENVEVLAAETPAGVELTFRLIPRHPVDDIEIQGNSGLDPAELERLVREQYGGLPTNARMRDLEETVERLLQGEGFRTPRVTASVVETHNPDRATLVFHAEAGPRTTIRSVTVEGASPYAKDTIVQRTGAHAGAPFRERAIATALVKIRDDLRNKRFYAAIATYTPPPEEGTEIDLVLRVEAGPEVDLRVEPADHLPKGGTDLYIPIHREGSIDPDLLDDAKKAIQAALQNDGYWKAEVSYTEDRVDPARLVITYKIARGKRYRVAALEMPSGLRITPELLAKEKALQVGEWFSEARATTALHRLVDLAYVQQGSHRAQVAPEFIGTPGRNADEGGVIIRPNITEGPRATVADILFDRGEKPMVTEAEVRSMMTLRKGAPYIQAQVQGDTEALNAYYASRGFQPELRMDVRFNETATEATISVVTREGPQLLVGEITVVGNAGISRETILDEITLRPGEPYSEDKRLESQRQLGTLGFRSIRIVPEPRLPGENTVRITISVEELPKTSIGGGGGIEVGNRARPVAGTGAVDSREISPRAFFEIGRRNLGGRNRDLNFFSRVALRSQQLRGEPLEGDDLNFTEYRVSGTYRERYAFHSNTDLLLGFTSEQAARSTFSYLRRLASADLLHAVTPRVSVSGRYALEFSRLFDRLPDEFQSFDLDRFFPQLRLSTLSGGVLWNRRNDAVAPTKGFQVGAAGDLALTQIGSEVGFVKGLVGAQFFRLLREAGTRRIVLATRAELGAARGFERPRLRLDEDGNEITELVKDVPANYRFFAGGSSTVRGFQLDRLGVPEILTVDGLSNGGNAEIILNAELRATVMKLFDRNLTAVGFVDSGQVFRLAGDLDFARLRGATGVGVRYDSPLGPVRLDFGFKMSPMIYANGRRERGWEYHFSLGEAF
jgi:outer membrane protein assembly factor BamA